MDYLDNIKDFLANVQNIKQIQFKGFNDIGFNYEEKTSIFNDEDFCLIHEFPFRQLVVLNIDLKETDCATIWLVRYYDLYAEQSGIKEFKSLGNVFKILKNRSIIDQCEFEAKIKLCKEINETKSFIKPKKIYEFDFMIISQFLLDISTPIMCLLGIIANRTCCHISQRKR